MRSIKHIPIIINRDWKPSLPLVPSFFYYHQSAQLDQETCVQATPGKLLSALAIDVKKKLLRACYSAMEEYWNYQSEKGQRRPNVEKKLIESRGYLL